MNGMQFVSLGVKLLDEKGEMVSSSSASMIPLGDPSAPGWAEQMAQTIVVMLPALAKQATSAIVAIDPTMRLSTAALLEATAKELKRSGLDGTPQVYQRIDGDTLEVRTILPLKKPEPPAPAKGRKTKP